MEKFNTHTGLVVPLDIANVDTDQIIPARFLTVTTREGMGEPELFQRVFKGSQGDLPAGGRQGAMKNTIENTK